MRHGERRSARTNGLRVWPHQRRSFRARRDKAGKNNSGQGKHFHTYRLESILEPFRVRVPYRQSERSSGSPAGVSFNEPAAVRDEGKSIAGVFTGSEKEPAVGVPRIQAKSSYARVRLALEPYYAAREGLKRVA